MANTLFDIQGEFLRLYEFGEDEEAFADTLESLEFDLSGKANGYVNVMKQLEMEADKAEEVGKAFMAKAAARRHNVTRIKNRLQYVMQSLGKDKIPAGEYTILNKKNGGVAPLDYDRDDVPPEFYMVKRDIDEKKIREFLKDNTCTWARLKERGHHIEVK